MIPTNQDIIHINNKNNEGITKSLSKERVIKFKLKIYYIK